MTVANDVTHVAENWSGGEVGRGAINQGNSDNAPWLKERYALSSGDDSHPCVGTGNDRCTDRAHGDFSQKRTHRLSNGEVVWDLAGNVWEWVDWIIPPESRIAIGPEDLVWYELASLEANQVMPARSFRPDEPWSSKEGVGKYYPGHPGSGGAAVRGGYWGRPENAGVFALHLSRDAQSVMQHAGFRCVRAL